MSSPEVKSFEQLYGEAVSAFLAKIGVNDLNPNSVTASLFSANALMVYRSLLALERKALAILVCLPPVASWKIFSPPKALSTIYSKPTPSVFLSYPVPSSP